ncbi:SGNH/GDSL hydrolase family protein [Saccharicrinis fermentans]|uniref:Endoglucanase E n=1 Tax=Saccharicrinis fermentans DSM 9555 = JCM 21142 TaxID=869213 RepID=W7Y6J3_9BACT|nr:hypothetical protein [Saccharicrinis fermentans]GAF03827.1 endoglucanase E precursor [Saccharicrinis fermentans DSM 9555 = JCM 21142]
MVVNLFQNDSWIVNRPNYEQFISRFGTKKPNEDFIINAYKNFIASLRTKHPQSYIICALGNMDATIEGSLWPGYIQAAVNQLNDDRMYTCFFPFKNTGGHPKVDEHHAMANQLIGFIDQNIAW